MHSIESEKLVLATAMNTGRRPLLDGLLGLISASDFHTEMHGILWGCIRVLAETGGSYDATSVLDYTRRKNLFVGGVEYLASLVEDPLASAASDESVLSAASRIKTFSTLRSLRLMLQEATAMCEQGPDSLETVFSFIDDGAQSLRKTLHTSRTGPQSMPEIMDEVMNQMELHMDGKVTPATPTGYPALDNIINGLADEDLIVIGARPSMGKTAFLVNIAENISDQGEQVLIFSLEMKKTALGQRALARKARVDLSNIMRAELTDSDWPRVVEGLEKLRNSKVWIDDSPGLTIHDIRARSRAFVAKHGKCKIAVDYLQYVSQSDRSGKNETKDHVSEVSRGLKNLARELKCPVVALSQLSRTLESRTNKRPMMSDLRESGAIEQDADIIMFLYRDEYYNPDTKEPGIVELITAKHRNGPTGVAKLGFIGSISAFTDMGTI